MPNNSIFVSVLFLVLSMKLWTNCLGLPLYSDAVDIDGTKEAHLNKTMAAKTQLMDKVESALIKTWDKLVEKKAKLNDEKDKMKAKLASKLSEEVEKWTAVGEKLREEKSAALTKLAEKIDAIKEQKVSIKKAKSTASLPAKPTTAIVPPAVVPTSSTKTVVTSFDPAQATTK